jgi:RNA polymerase sigma factor (sigma-70 family)
MGIPVTSMTLLKVLGDDAQSPRWTEFANKYASTIDGFLFKYFPSVDAADVVNETLIALVQKLPVYVYDPDAKGHFRNFLIGIVRYKAIEQIKKRKQEADRREALETQALLKWEYEKQSYSVDLRDWQREAYEAALAQFMADPGISARDKEIFRRVALRGESPEDVAGIFDIKRNNVDQIKARMVAKLKELALRYAEVCEKQD